MKKEIREQSIKPETQFTTEVLIGDVYGTQDMLSKQFQIYPNPLLLKQTNVGASPTPLTVKASQYNHYRIQKWKVKATSLCSSAITGTTILFGYQTAPGGVTGESSVDSFYALPHRTGTAGRDCFWSLAKRDTNTGSIPGGWFLVGTNAGPDATNGWYVDVLTQGKSTNLYTDTPYNGVMWRLTVEVTYQFANYQPEATTVDLSTETEEISYTVKNNADGEIVMETNSSALRLLFSRDIVPRGNSSSVGEVIVSVGDTLADTAETVLGPWGWLIKKGWWFVKKVFGAAGDNTLNQYQVYPSWQAAQQNMPATGTMTPYTSPTHKVCFAQLNSPNLGATANSVITQELNMHQPIPLPGNFSPKLPEPRPGIMIVNDSIIPVRAEFYMAARGEPFGTVAVARHFYMTRWGDQEQGDWACPLPFLTGNTLARQYEEPNAQILLQPDTFQWFTPFPGTYFEDFEDPVKTPYSWPSGASKLKFKSSPSGYNVLGVIYPAATLASFWLGTNRGVWTKYTAPTCLAAILFSTLPINGKEMIIGHRFAMFSNSLVTGNTYMVAGLAPSVEQDEMSDLKIKVRELADKIAELSQPPPSPEESEDEEWSGHVTEEDLQLSDQELSEVDGLGKEVAKIAIKAVAKPATEACLRMVDEKLQMLEEHRQRLKLEIKKKLYNEGLNRRTRRAIVAEQSVALNVPPWQVLSKEIDAVQNALTSITEEEDLIMESSFYKV